MKLLRLAPGVALKQKRLASLLGGRAPEDEPRLRAAVEDAQVLGSLQLSGLDHSWSEVQAARRGEPAPAAIGALRRALAAVPSQAHFSLDALRAWHAAALGAPSAWRRAARVRDEGPPPAPPEFIASRLELLAGWLRADSSRELGPAQAGALVMARLIEIAPFDDANGRVARLAASHVMVRAGARPPVLVGADRPRLEAALQAASCLHTEPLTALLDEAAERALDVMLQTLEGRA
jgi:hypothetical protein